MTKLSEKFERAKDVILVMPSGMQRTLKATERHACAHALSGGLQNWEQRCAALYQVIGYMAHEFGVFDSDDVSAALDVAAGRGDVEKLLPWPNKPLKALRPEELERLPMAFIQHHKGGDNLVWEDPGGDRTPLYRLSAPQEER